MWRPEPLRAGMTGTKARWWISAGQHCKRGEQKEGILEGQNPVSSPGQTHTGYLKAMVQGCQLIHTAEQ